VFVAWVRDDGGVLKLTTPTPLPAEQTQAAQNAIDVSPWLGIIVLLLIGAVYLLWRSLKTQVRKIDFDETALTDEERMKPTE